MTLDESTSTITHDRGHDVEKVSESSTRAPDTARDAPVEKSDGNTNGLDEPDEEPKRTITGLKWFAIYTSLMSTVLLFALDNTIVATIQPDIVETFDDQTSLAWIGVSFILGQVVILPVGKAYGIFNMKVLFLVSLILFEAGSAICGAAPNMVAIVVGRVIAGVGGAGVYVGGLTYISILTTPHERSLYLAILMSVWGFGNVLGPIIGGSFAVSSATWRWGFYINLPIAGIFAPVFLFMIPNINAMPDTSFSKKLRMQDWVGITVFTALLACFCMAGSFGGTLYAWNSGSEIVLWVVTFVLFVAFVLVTIYHPLVPTESRLLPVQFMVTRDLFIIPLQAFLVAGSMMMSIYYTPLVFQFTRGDSPLMAGVRILPLIFIIGLGIGAFQSAGIGVASALAPASQISNVVSVMTIAQVIGITFALAIPGSIFQNKAMQYIASVLPDIPQGKLGELITGASGKSYKSLSEADQLLVVDQITTAIREAFYYLVGTTAIGFITSLFLSPKKLFHSASSVA
ncbi:major facilitator superfamily transporter [Seiridium cupressi]